MYINGGVNSSEKARVEEKMLVEIKCMERCLWTSYSKGAVSRCEVADGCWHR